MSSTINIVATPVAGRADFGFDTMKRCLRIERRRGNHHAGTGCCGGEVAHDHPEAGKRDGNTNPLIGAEPIISPTKFITSVVPAVRREGRACVGQYLINSGHRLDCQEMDLTI